ncbi:MAG: hypothetical protein OIF50_12005 [Flavobacteriaceae bacterium]|nr:hypothetical protein [Flavobacteriaceae bacterium]
MTPFFKKIPSLPLACFLLLCQSFLVSAQSTQPTSSVELDFTAAEAFLELCQTDTPQPSQIYDLLELPAYTQLFVYLKNNWGKQYNKDLYQKMLLACFLPEQYPLQPEHKKHQWIWRYFQKMKNNKAQIAPYIHMVRTHLNTNTVMQRLLAYLPQKPKPRAIPIYFLLGIKQGSASAAGVFIDNFQPTTPANIKKYLEPWIAHEVHHFFRADYNHLAESCFDRQPKLCQALYWLETEGIAERVGALAYDLEHYLHQNPKQASRYMPFVPTMKKFQNQLWNYTQNPTNAQSLIDLLQPKQGPNLYHEIGHKMAFLIEKQLGREQLLLCLGKPKQFFLQYQYAATAYAKPDAYPYCSPVQLASIKKFLNDF